jgi:hypothetical protein
LPDRPALVQQLRVDDPEGHAACFFVPRDFCSERPMPSSLTASRWVQLLLGLVVMMAISSPQYVWTLFVKPFQAATGAGLPTVQITFSVLIVLQTLFSPALGSGRRR